MCFECIESTMRKMGAQQPEVPHYRNACFLFALDHKVKTIFFDDLIFFSWIDLVIPKIIICLAEVHLLKYAQSTQGAMVSLV